MISKQNPQKLSTLLNIMKALRDPQSGCPWDVKQTFKSITPYTIEEAYEVVDAIERNDMEDLCDELGDLLLQVVFLAQLADEQNSFAIENVIEAICTKMIRRHPHVFGDAEQRSKKPQKGFWEDIKAQENGSHQKKYTLDSIPTALPALSRANKLQSKAARKGFDWSDVSGVFEKLAEEIDELKQAKTQDEINEELGDLMFTIVNLTRHYGQDPEQILRQANTKFQNRFTAMEQASKVDLKELTAGDMEELWQKAKAKLGN